MHATAQRDEQVSLLPLDLNPPVRAESIDLRALISHRSATQASASVESVADTFKTGSVNFVAVLEGQRLLGMCSRQETAALLGGRYGFSLWARKPIRNHLCKQETRIKVATPIGDVLRTVFARPDENFYDDVLLVDENGGFLGIHRYRNAFQGSKRAFADEHSGNRRARPRDSPEKRADGNRSANGDGIAAGAHAEHVSDFSGRRRRGRNEAPLLSPLFAGDPDGRRFLSHRTAKRRHGRHLYLRCDGPWRPRSADHRDDARHDRNSRYQKRPIPVVFSRN